MYIDAELPHLRLGTMNQRTNCPYRYLEDITDLVIAPRFEEVENEDFSVFFFHLLEDARHRLFDILTTHLCARILAVRERLDEERDIGIIERKLILCFALAKEVNRVVVRDAIYPRREGNIGIIAIEMTVYLDKNLLQNIICISLINLCQSMNISP